MIESLQITRFGGPEVLQINASPLTAMGSGDVRIGVKAAGVNFADLMMRIGAYPEAPKPPFTPGYEISGVVLEVGDEVRGLSVGESVVAGTRFGGYASEVVLPRETVRKAPAGLSHEEAAAIPVNFLTAWMALEEMGRVRRGDRVLVQSAAGGVGVAAVQIAATAGAHVTGLVGSMAKADVVKSLGASEVMTTQEWESGSDQDLGGYQIILDSTGGASVKRSFRRLASAGRLINYGVADMIEGSKRSWSRTLSVLAQTAVYTPFHLMMANKGVYGLNLLKLYEPSTDGRPNIMVSALDQVLDAFEQKRLKVIVGKTFPLADGGAAHTYLQSRANIGKVILTV